MVGKTIGSYEIIEKIGKGGMGVVYLAKHKLIGRKAAIKLLLPKFSSQPTVIERFFNEARAATAIDHPGIVEIFDFGYHEGAAYLVMEFLKGQSLDDRIKEHRCLAVEAAIPIVRQIASALGEAHKAGIVHRDLKPENIFLVADPDVQGGERIRILDFGIAKLTQSSIEASSTRTGAVMGTPSYMSPEQCTGAKNVDHRTDLYALGCILFEMLCGRPPFIGQGAGTVIAAHMYAIPPRPSSMSVIPPEVESLTLRLLSKVPNDRFADTSELTRALDALPDLTGYGLRAMAAAPDTLAGRAPSDPDMGYPTVTLGVAAAPSTTLGGVPAQMVSSMPPERPSGKRWLIPVIAAFAVGALVAFTMVQGGEQTPDTVTSSRDRDRALQAEAPDTVADTTPDTQPTSVATATQPAQVKITVETAPEGAELFLEIDGTLHSQGVTPVSLQRPVGTDEFTLIAELDGYQSKRFTAKPDESRSFSFELQPVPRSGKMTRKATRKSTRRRSGKRPKKTESGSFDPYGDSK